MDSEIIENTVKVGEEGLTLELRHSSMDQGKYSGRFCLYMYDKSFGEGIIDPRDRPQSIYIWTNEIEPLIDALKLLAVEAKMR